ncbi:MAG: ATP-binding protein [Chitinophagaceae bacterium]
MKCNILANTTNKTLFKKRENITSFQLSFAISFIIACIIGITLLIFTKNNIASILISLLILAITFFLIQYAISRIVFDKVSLLYKLINNTKNKEKESFRLRDMMAEQNLHKIQKKTNAWAEEKNNQVVIPQNNEKYRREFLMNLTHELRTPIFSTQGYIETLLDGAIDDKETAINFLERTSKNIDRLVTLVDDVDIISRIESNQLPINKEVFVIQPIIQDVLLELGQMAQKKNIKCYIKKGCESPAVSVLADISKIRQVLVNLIQNAIKYGVENGEVSIGIYAIDELTTLVEISDNGIGIAEDQIKRVFERFYRTDAARSREYGGTGLGLAIVKHIIESHGHHVYCRSTMHIGTTFGFTLTQRKNY